LPLNFSKDGSFGILSKRYIHPGRCCGELFVGRSHRDFVLQLFPPPAAVLFSCPDFARLSREINSGLEGSICSRRLTNFIAALKCPAFHLAACGNPATPASLPAAPPPPPAAPTAHTRPEPGILLVQIQRLGDNRLRRL